MEQQMIILIYSIIGVSIAMFFTLFVRMICIKRAKKKKKKEYLKWRKKFHDNFIYIEKTWEV